MLLRVVVRLPSSLARNIYPRRLLMAATDVTRSRDGSSHTNSPGLVRRLSTETKAAFKTTEFFLTIAVIAGILVSAAVIKGTGKHVDIFQARHAWLYVAIVTGAYTVGRGLAKSGSRQPYDEDNR
jgi:hypothetical protein